jgi:uncharacterized protein YciI
MYFLCKLIPPRPTFPGDMTAAERETMMKHVAYWKALLERGSALAFGPVADPAGPWGVALIAVADEGELQALQAADPAIQARIGMRYEAYPMPQLLHGG